MPGLGSNRYSLLAANNNSSDDVHVKVISRIKELINKLFKLEAVSPKEANKNAIDVLEECNETIKNTVSNTNTNVNVLKSELNQMRSVTQADTEELEESSSQKLSS